MIMSILKLPVLYLGTKGEKHIYTLFDSGADFSCINPELVKDIETPIRLSTTRRLVTASEDKIIKVTERCVLDFYINDVLLSDEFLIVPGLSEEAVIGASTLQKWRIKLNFEHDIVEVNPKVANHQIKGSMMKWYY
jgi:hypothetical protein